ncbi:LysR family transcriptional regulator [Luteibacter sp. SG786]|uniref:LysR substrate-binding domain-containing protein n=1 Tax=Luteibacter sp. SG786 TaxID=2587130 RepID=UPI001422A9E4|nr:DNA-binding transcriptional LysR family regulator [Luteibacter sp. SG786]
MERLLAMQLFVRVVETGTFARAAASLRIPTSSATKLVQALEGTLGVQLLERTTRRVSVTAEGAAYYEHVRRMLEELDDVEAQLGHRTQSPKGLLRVDTGGSVAAQLLIPGLVAFRARYPLIHLQIGVTDRTVDLPSEGVDCAIRSTADDPLLITRKVAELPWTLCAAPSYLAERGHPASVEDLSRHDLVGYFSARSGRPAPLSLRTTAGHVERFDWTYALEVNESNAHAAAARHGLGIVQTLRFQVADELADGRLVEILPALQPPPLPVYLVYPPSRRNNARVRAFVEWILDDLPRRAGVERAS